jgi:hypothetical protein
MIYAHNKELINAVAVFALYKFFLIKFQHLSSMKKSNQILLSLVITSVMGAPIFAQSTQLDKTKSKKDTTERKRVRTTPRVVGTAIPPRVSSTRPAPARVVTPPAPVRTTTPSSAPHVSTPSSSHVTTGGFGGSASHGGFHASS